MKRFAELVSSSLIVQAVLSILLGLLLAIMPQTTVITVVYLLAAYLAVTGIVSLVTYARHRKDVGGSQSVLATGILLIIIALVVFIFPEAVAGVFSLILGILLALSGITNAVRSFELKKYGGSSWIGTLIISAAVAIGGVVIIVNPFDSTVTFVLVLGILLIAKGVIELVVQAMLSKQIKASL